MTNPGYLAAVYAARQVAYAANLAQARQLAAAMTAYAERLTAGIARLPPDAQLAARDSSAIVRAAAQELEARIARNVATGADVTFSRTFAIWQRAAAKVHASALPGAALGALQPGNLTMAATGTSASTAATFRTLIAGHTRAAQEEVSAIVRSALLSGASNDSVAQALRPYVLGRDKAPPLLAPYIAEQPIARRGAAYAMEFNARRIAFSEMHTARREAEVEHFKRDPLIAFGRWTLSPNRGKTRLPDACDALAGLDWYGLGVGIYPLRQVPLPPHPFDRCEVIPVVLKTTQLGGIDPDALRPLVLDPWSVALPDGGLLTPAADARIRRVLATILASRSGRAARAPPALTARSTTRPTTSLFTAPARRSSPAT